MCYTCRYSDGIDLRRKFVMNGGVAQMEAKEAGKEKANRDYGQIIPKWLDMANSGDAKAQYNMGVLYHKGQGVTQDYSQAAQWYYKAAMQGHVKAQLYLGTLYQSGRGVQKDYAQAGAWYLKAAKQNDAKAQYCIGLLYYNGYGIKQDREQAKIWFLKASEQGNEQANSMLLKMNTKRMNDEGERLSDESVKGSPVASNILAHSDIKSNDRIIPSFSFGIDNILMRLLYSMLPFLPGIIQYIRLGVVSVSEIFFSFAFLTGVVFLILTALYHFLKTRFGKKILIGCRGFISKLIISYVIYPFTVVYMLSYILDGGLRGLINIYLFVLLCPSIIRFAVKRKGTKYGVETYFYTILSIAINLLLLYAYYGVVSLVSCFDIFAIANILTCKSISKNTSQRGTCWILTLVSFVLVFFYAYIMSKIYPFFDEYHIFIWTFFSLCYVLHSHTRDDTEQQDTLSTGVLCKTTNPSAKSNAFFESTSLEEAYIHLGVSPYASAKEIESAYERKKRLLNPSAFPEGSPEWEEARRMTQIIDASYRLVTGR